MRLFPFADNLALSALSSEEGSIYLRDVVGRQQVFVQLEEVVHMLVQPEEGRVASRSLKMLHDARGHAVALERVRHLGQHHVTVIM
jgi:hypothetical protein